MLLRVFERFKPSHGTIASGTFTVLATKVSVEAITALNRNIPLMKLMPPAGWRTLLLCLLVLCWGSSLSSRAQTPPPPPGGRVIQLEVCKVARPAPTGEIRSILIKHGHDFIPRRVQGHQPRKDQATFHRVIARPVPRFGSLNSIREATLGQHLLTRNKPLPEHAEAYLFLVPRPRLEMPLFARLRRTDPFEQEERESWR